MSPSRTAILMAGGASRRMGAPKALLEIEGEPLACRIARTLGGPCDRLILSLASPRSSADRASAEIERRVREATLRPVSRVTDPVPDQGPIAGLSSSLEQTETEFAFVAACDTPFLREDLVEAMLRRAEREEGVDVVLPVLDGRPEPLVAVYRASTMAPHFAERLGRGVRRLTDGIAARRVVRLETPELRRIDPGLESFENVNSPEDWTRALATISRAGQ